MIEKSLKTKNKALFFSLNKKIVLSSKNDFKLHLNNPNSHFLSRLAKMLVHINQF